MTVFLFEEFTQNTQRAVISACLASTIGWALLSVALA